MLIILCVLNSQLECVQVQLVDGGLSTLFYILIWILEIGILLNTCKPKDSLKPNFDFLLSYYYLPDLL